MRLCCSRGHEAPAQHDTEDHSPCLHQHGRSFLPGRHTVQFQSNSTRLLSSSIWAWVKLEPSDTFHGSEKPLPTAVIRAEMFCRFKNSSTVIARRFDRS